MADELINLIKEIKDDVSMIWSNTTSANEVSELDDKLDTLNGRISEMTTLLKSIDATLKSIKEQK
jgi:hypothetical protein